MKILIAVDGSELALNAVRHGLALRLEGLRASFVLATVQDPTYLYEMVLAPDAEVLERASAEAGAHALESAEALFKAAGVRVKREIGSGDPAQTLVEIAELNGCELIILGARGLGSLRGALLGSVSQAVLRAAKVAVTVVKDVEADIDDADLEEPT